MLAPPKGLSDDDVRAVVREHWSLTPRTFEHAPVGFGSYHWLTESHFVTVDEVGDHEDLTAALRTARALRDDAGLTFVHAAEPTGDGDLVVPIGDEWLVHVYARLDVIDETAFGPHDDPEVVELVRWIHDATPVVQQHALVEDFDLRDREDMEEAMSELDEPWDTGPYGDRCRVLLREHQDVVRAMLARHDEFASGVSRDDWVVTHGEPHRGNVFRTTDGWKVVDWDTALVAPPERDWWDMSGVSGDPAVEDLYRLRWELGEVGVCTAVFFDEHTGDANDVQSWEGFVTYLDRLVARATPRA